MRRKMGMARGWHGRFKECGYRMTMGREAILDALSNTDDHLSAEDIYFKVKKTYPAIGLTTIYRTLDILVNLGFVFKFDFGDGRARYELTENSKSSKHHHHLICSGCKRIIDYQNFIDQEIDLFKKTEKALSKKHDFDIRNHMVQFYGICSKCKNK